MTIVCRMVGTELNHKLMLGLRYSRLVLGYRHMDSIRIPDLLLRRHMTIGLLEFRRLIAMFPYCLLLLVLPALARELVL